MTGNVEKINVLWLYDHLGYDGIMHGAGMYCLYTLPIFEKNRFDITLCVLRDRDHLTKEFEDRGVKVIHLGRGKLDPVTLFDLVNLVKEERISLIHAHGYGSNNFGRLAGIIRGIPAIVHAHDHDHYYPWYQGFADYLLSGYTDKAIAVSESVKESCIKKRRIPEDRVVAIHNGVPLERFWFPEDDQAERERLGIAPGFKVVGSITRLREEKGNRYLLDAATRLLKVLPNTVFLLVGDGPMREELEAYSRRLGIGNRVIFTGFREDIPHLLSLFDVKVMPSLAEGSPSALLEAMAMGKPIVATNVGGIKEILRDGETGLLVPSKDAEALSDKIIHLLKNMDEAKRLGMRAREESKKYDINFYVKRLEKEYYELISSSN